MSDNEHRRFRPGDIVQHRASGEFGIIVKQDDLHKHRWWVSTYLTGDEFPVHEIVLEIAGKALPPVRPGN